MNLLIKQTFSFLFRSALKCGLELVKIVGYYSDLVVKFELGRLVICKKIPQDHNIIAEKL